MRNGTVRIVTVNLFVLAAFGQTLTLQKEYVYLGSRLIAVDSPAGTGGTPTAPTVSASSGNPTNLTGQPAGVDHTGTFVVKGTSTGGGANIDFVEGIFTSKTYADPRYGCYFLATSDGSIYLGADAGYAGGWVTGSGSHPGSGVTLSNSSCSINLISGISVVVSGNDLVVTLPIAFKPIFASPQNLHLLAGDKGTPALNSGWVQVPGYSLTAQTPPSVTFGKSLTSSNADGIAAVFTYTFTNYGTFGVDYIATGNLLMNRGTYDGNHACFIAFNRADNSFTMALNGNYGIAGNTGIIDSTYCSLNLAQSSIVRINDYQLKVAASVTFKQPGDASVQFRGLMGRMWNYVELFTRGGVSDSPVAMTNFYVIRPNPTAHPTMPADAVVPTNWNGTGAPLQPDGTKKQTFAFKMDHAFSGRYFDWIQANFNDQGRCYFYYGNADDVVYLATSSGGQWSGFQYRGNGAPLDNGSCRVNQNTAQVDRTATSLKLTMEINFYQTYFVGQQWIRMYGQDRGGNDDTLQRNPTVGSVTIW